MAEGQKFYHVTLTSGERSELQRMLSSGRHAARKLTHARVLLMSDSNPGGSALTDREIHGALGSRFPRLSGFVSALWKRVRKPRWFASRRHSAISVFSTARPKSG